MKTVFSLVIGFLSVCSAGKAQSDTLGHEAWEYMIEDAGDILQLALPVSAGLLTLLEKDFSGTKKLLLSYGTTMLITYSLKYITRKERPEGRKRFDSFPSGHTSSAFAGAAFLQRRYGWDYGVPAYILATLVGISRMEGPDGYHDIYDVLGGALIGIGSSYLLTKPYERPKIEVRLSYNRNCKVVSFISQF